MTTNCPMPQCGRRSGVGVDTVGWESAVIGAAGSEAMAGVGLIGDGDAEDVAAQVIERLAAGAGRLTMDHPVFVPDLGRRLRRQLGLLQCRAHFGTEDDRQCFYREQISRVLLAGPGATPPLPSPVPGISPESL